MTKQAAAKLMLSVLANRPDPTAQAYDVLTHLYYRLNPKLQYWNFGRWNDSAYLHFAEIAACWEAPLLLKNICPDSGQIREAKYDWSLAHDETKLITTNANGDVREWFGAITDELDLVVNSDQRWQQNPDSSDDKYHSIYVKWTSRVDAFKGNWQASAEMRPSLQKQPYQQVDFLTFLRRTATLKQIEARELDMGVSLDCACPFVTPESLVNDIKAGQP